MRVNHKPYSLSTTFVFRADSGMEWEGVPPPVNFVNGCSFSAQRLRFFEKRVVHDTQSTIVFLVTVIVTTTLPMKIKIVVDIDETDGSWDVRTVSSDPWESGGNSLPDVLNDVECSVIHELMRKKLFVEVKPGEVKWKFH